MRVMNLKGYISLAYVYIWSGVDVIIVRNSYREI